MGGVHKGLLSMVIDTDAIIFSLVIAESIFCIVWSLRRGPDAMRERHRRRTTARGREMITFGFISLGLFLYLTRTVEWVTIGVGLTVGGMAGLLAARRTIERQIYQSASRLRIHGWIPVILLGMAIGVLLVSLVYFPEPHFLRFLLSAGGALPFVISGFFIALGVRL